VLASMMVWSLVGADELDSTKQEDRAGFGPAARQVVDAQALQFVGACCRAETDVAVVAAVAAADVAVVAAAGDAVVAVVEKATVVAVAVEGAWREAGAQAKKAKQVADRAACSVQPTSVNQQLEVCPPLARLPHIYAEPAAYMLSQPHILVLYIQNNQNEAACAWHMRVVH
jgi:hypothetical protein